MQHNNVSIFVLSKKVDYIAHRNINFIARVD